MLSLADLLSCLERYSNNEFVCFQLVLTIGIPYDEYMSQCVRGHYSRYQIPTVSSPVYHLMMKWLVHSLARTASLQATYAVEGPVLVYLCSCF